MSDDASRFVFSGHAVGAAARFHRLDEATNLNHVIPALGASVLPPTGGLSKSEVANYCFEVAHPRRRSLLSVHRIESRAEGREVGAGFETETEARIDSLTVAGKLHIEHIQVHVLAARDPAQQAARVSTKGNRVDGVHLGNVTAKVILDDEPLSACGSAEEFRRLRGTAPQVREQNGIYLFSLVRDIQLSGPEVELAQIEKHGNALRWKGFGWIYFAEVIVKAQDRQVTMVRLQMGSDAGGSGTAGDAQSNGQVITS